MTADPSAYSRSERYLIETFVHGFDQAALRVRAKAEAKLRSDPGAGRVMLGTARGIEDIAAGIAALLGERVPASATAAPPASGSPPLIEAVAEPVPPSPISRAPL